MKFADKGKKASQPGEKSWRSVLVTIVNICEEAWVYIFHFRKVLLCLPIVFASIYLARLNWTLLPAGPLSLADQRVYADPACVDPDHECISVLRAVTNAAGMAAFVLFSSYLEV